MKDAYSLNMDPGIHLRINEKWIAYYMDPNIYFPINEVWMLCKG